MKKFFEKLCALPLAREAGILLAALLARYGIGLFGGWYMQLLFLRAGLYDGAVVPGWAAFLSEAGNGILTLCAALVVLLCIAKPEKISLRALCPGGIAAAVSAGILLLADSVRYAPAVPDAADCVNLLGVVAWCFAACAVIGKILRKAEIGRPLLRCVLSAAAFAALMPVSGGGWLYWVNLLLAGALLAAWPEAGAGYAAWAMLWEAPFGAFTGRGLLRTVSEEWLVGATPAGGGMLTAILVGGIVIRLIRKNGRKNS